MATIHDVATAAGVSIATVSRALNGGGRVGERTRRRVLELAASMDYRPSQAARGLATGRLGSIGVMVPDVANPFFGPTLSEVTTLSQERGYGTFLADSREDVDSEVELLTRLSRQVDGLILVSPRIDEEKLRFAVGGLPVVLVNRRVSGLDSVSMDAAQGMSDLLRKLALMGHRHVVYIDGPPASRSGEAKRAGLHSAAGAMGVDLEILDSAAPTFGAGRAVASQVVASGASAVIGFNDMLAWGALTRARELGTDVPGQLSVAGFDDALEEGMVFPGLTTVAPRNTELGTRAATRLLERLTAVAADINGTPSAASAEILHCDVVLRGSTAPPA